MIREPFFQSMGEEIPYSIAVEVVAFKEDERLIRIEALVYVERESQKGMVIGKGGQVIKRIGVIARKNMEAYFQKKIFLDLKVKVLKNWSKDERSLRKLGYSHPRRKVKKQV